MVMHISGTFDYTFTVPHGPRSGSRRMNGILREAPEHDPRRLVGHAPVLEALEYQLKPWQLFSRVTLTPADPVNALVKAFAFSVDRALIRMLRTDDVLHLSRTNCAGLGLSVLREGRLVAAAGAVTSVPLGTDVRVRHPYELVRRAEAIFRTSDSEYHMANYPVEVRIGGVTRLLESGRPTMGEYDVLVRHGFLFGMPGTNECVSIERRKVCPDTAAHTSAQLMEEESQQIG
jgi:hypothetical protein